MNLFVLKTWLEAKFDVTDDGGAGLVEYLLLVALIALVAVVAIQFFTGKVGSKFSANGNSLNY